MLLMWYVTVGPQIHAECPNKIEQEQLDGRCRRLQEKANLQEQLSDHFHFGKKMLLNAKYLKSYETCALAVNVSEKINFHIFYLEKVVISK